MEASRAETPGVMPLTAARAQLFELVESVLAGRSRRIELSHRSHDEHVVLMRKSELDGLEADLRALRARLASEARPLRGLATLNVEPDEVLVRARARQALKVAEKRASLELEAENGGGA